MGFEIRRVPPNWEHPRWTADDVPSDKKHWIGEYRRCYDSTFEEASKEWIDGLLAWQNGERPDYMTDKDSDTAYWEYHGNPPDRSFYRPAFTKEPTWFQVYQTVSEGSPVTPPFATEDELIDYLVEYGDFWYQKARGTDRDRFFSKPSRESATAFVKGGWAPSMVVTNGPDGVSIEDGINACH